MSIIIQEIVKEGENNKVKFLSNDATDFEIAREIVAFANSVSGGKIILGVNDDGSLDGFSSLSIKLTFLIRIKENIVNT